MNNRIAVLISALLIVGTLIGIGVFITSRVSSAAAHEYKFVIPEGTGDQIASNHESSLPSKIELTAGDTLVIENRDSVGHQIGDFWVGAGETTRQKFNTPAVYEGSCSAHKNSQIQIVVKAK